MGCTPSMLFDHKSRRRNSTGSQEAALAKIAPTPVCQNKAVQAARAPRASLESDGFSVQLSSKKDSYVSQMGNNFATQLHIKRISGHLPDEYDDVEIVPRDSENGVAAAAAPVDNDVTNLAPDINSDIDSELLNTLGDLEDEPQEWGEDIQEVVAKRFQRTLLQGLPKAEKDLLIKKYETFPKNAPLTKPPSLNPELATNMLQENAKNRDKRLFEKQSQLGRALAALGSAMTSLLKKNMDKALVMKKLNDVGQLLCDSHYTETETRRALIIPLIDKSLVESFKNRKRDNFLFGDKLNEMVQNSRGIIRTGQMIQGPTPSTSGANLNWRGPPSRYRQQYRSGQSSQPYRAGGQQRTFSYTQRRRPPPPQPRRQPPPPPRRQPARGHAATTQYPRPPMADRQT